MSERLFSSTLLARKRSRPSKYSSAVYSRLGELGVHPYFLPQISRLFKGGGYNHNDSEAARLYAEKMGIAKKEN